MVAGADVKLYGMWASMAVRRVEWALKMKGIEYEYIDEDLANKSPALLEFNPIHKQVPVLVHDGQPIVESLVIIEYIDETWKGKKMIMPEKSYERAMARFWATFAENKYHASKAAFGEGDGERGLRHMEDILRELEGELKGKRFFGGESIGYLDLVLGWIAFWLGVVEEAANFKVMDPQKFPQIASWIEHFLQDELIKANIPDREQTVEFFYNFQRYGYAGPPTN